MSNASDTESDQSTTTKTTDAAPAESTHPHSDQEPDSEPTTTHQNRDTQADQASDGTTENSVHETDVDRFAPTNLIERTDVSLEDVRGSVPTCSGRGSETAAVRGYNTERLANVIFSPTRLFFSSSDQPWYDTYVNTDHDIGCWIESKSCIQRYPCGQYGRFRIWKHHHERFIEEAQSFLLDTVVFMYFFLVYTIEDDDVREVGKLIVPPEQIDSLIDTWSVRDHTSMGQCRARDISWSLLLKRLDVPKPVFREQSIVDLTDGLPTDQSEESDSPNLTQC